MRPTTAVSSEENVEIPRNSSEDVDFPFRQSVRGFPKKDPLQPFAAGFGVSYPILALKAASAPRPQGGPRLRKSSKSREILPRT